MKLEEMKGLLDSEAQKKADRFEKEYAHLTAVVRKKQERLDRLEKHLLWMYETCAKRQDRMCKSGNCPEYKNCGRMRLEAEGKAVESIKRVPSSDVRLVVFCKDCKRYGGRPWENNESGICARTDVGVGEFDFCSYGEKKEKS